MNVLIIGLGSIAKKHIYALNELIPDVKIYAWRSQPDAATSPGITNIYQLEVPDVTFDFVIVSNPTASHLETIRQLTALKIPLFIEKPLFHQLPDGEAIVTECLDKGIQTYIACNLRFHPCISYLKEYLKGKQESINEVNVYCGSYLPNWRPNQDFRKVYSSRPELGGGVHLDLIHELDYTCWLLGMPMDVKKILRNKSTLHIPAIDFAHYTFLYPAYTANITLNYYRKDTKRTLEILLDDATLVADLVSNTVTIDNTVVFKEPSDAHYTYIRQMDYFLQHFRQEQPLMNNISEAFEILKVCLQG